MGTISETDIDTEAFVIAIVDDHRMFLEGFSMMVAQLNKVYEVCSYSDPEDFILDLSHQSSFDLLICDLLMTKMNGLTVMRMFRKSHPDTPVLALSGTSLDVPMSMLKSLNVMGFLHKTEGIEVLSDAISAVISGQTYFPADVHALPVHATDVLLDGDDEQEKGLPELTIRQVQVLQLLAQGASYREISAALEISENTVKTHMKQIFAALLVNNRTSCIRRALSLGII